MKTLSELLWFFNKGEVVNIINIKGYKKETLVLAIEKGFIRICGNDDYGNSLYVITEKGLIERAKTKRNKG